MTRKPPQDRFDIAVATLRATERGQEATMYGPLRDLFIEVLGYPPQHVDIDRSGARGRPDITVFAPGATDGSKVAWIVLEAKDEHDACKTNAKRAALFAAKSKYITADTAWFVMVDPTTLVARPADRGGDASTDIVLDLATLTHQSFVTGLAELRSDVAGVPHMLARFRAGDESLIAVDRLTGSADRLSETLARNAFFDGLEETTRHLQAATLSALTAIRSDRDQLTAEVDAFSARFHGHTFHPYPVSIEGRPKGREEAVQHGREAHRLNRLLASDPALSRLTLNALPAFAERTGINPATEADKLDRFFATETANLILARILLIRFLEDHGFFDEETPDGTRRRRYLCNGGVQAFQGMRDYFKARYTRLLADAYRSGARVYAAAFSETEHDWVLDLADDTLSRNVEWAMYRFARFDFTSIRGDILTGIYDRFLDRDQRKAQGEFYTPPAIARYMLDRLGLAAGDAVLDPACGSGTFLIERYQQAVGEDADRGVATYEDACAVVERIAGNDLNPFSAVLTQIQLLWHLLSFGQDVRREGIPPLHISERANSLVPTSLRDQTTTRFGDIDVPGYAAVIGNPPYVRPERGTALDATAHDYYTQSLTIGGTAFSGISAESNLYNLFIYRALDYWCSPPEGASHDRPPGRLAFVIPLAFCVANNSADLRALFQPGGRWTITEIVDLELVWKHVFDARVLPMVLFAEARPPREDDLVAVRHVDEASIVPPVGDRAARHTFNLDAAPLARLPYADLFTPEGRIATRLTPARADIARKLRALDTLSDAAKRYWTKRKGGFAARDSAPVGVGALHWEEQRMIGDGVARRGTGTENVTDGLDIYKGENIRTGGLTGDAVFSRLDVWNLSTPSFWRFPNLLPTQMWCLPILERFHVPRPSTLDGSRSRTRRPSSAPGPTWRHFRSTFS
jgi:SAM-dependent methyltransferase